MRQRSLILISLVLFVGTMPALAEDAEDEAKQTVIFERPIGDKGQRLVVIRGPNQDPMLFGFWSDAPELRDGFEHTARLYEVRVEMHSPGSEPLLLASHLRREWKAESDRGVIILDALIHPGAIVLAMARGSDLAIWRIGIMGGHTELLYVPQGGWSDTPAPYRITPDIVEVKLGRTDAGVLTVEVLEKFWGRRTVWEYEIIERSHVPFKLIRQSRDPLPE